MPNRTRDRGATTSPEHIAMMHEKMAELRRLGTLKRGFRKGEGLRRRFRSPRVKAIAYRINDILQKVEKSDIPPDAAKEILGYMLLEEAPQGGVTYLELMCSDLFAMALGQLKGGDVQSRRRAIEYIFERAYGRTSDSDSLFKHIKKAFGGFAVEFMNIPPDTKKAVPVSPEPAKLAPIEVSPAAPPSDAEDVPFTMMPDGPQTKTDPNNA